MRYNAESLDFLGTPPSVTAAISSAGRRGFTDRAHDQNGRKTKATKEQSAVKSILALTGRQFS
jgi:hypothetical protein